MVSEIDPGVVDVDTERLGLETGAGLRVRVEDGRLGVRRLDDASRDLVVGDAFGGVSVPWHLTTIEYVEEVRRVLRDDGVYAVNIIDYEPARLRPGRAGDPAPASSTTSRSRRDPFTLSGNGGGNLVAIASDSPIDKAAVERGFAERDLAWDVIDGDRSRTWVDGAPVLTDDYAPVDQLLTPHPSS